MLFCIMVCTYSLNAQTWEKIDMHFPQSDTLLSSSTISFATKNTGWIFTTGNTDNNIPPANYATKILKTVDGGNSWVLQKHVGNFFDIYSIHVLDTLHCWAIDGTGNLIFTSNGGADWDTSFISGEKGDYFTSLFFFNSQNGIAFSSYRWLTTDGGQSWLKGDDSTSVFPPPTDVFFSSGKLGWMVSEMSSFSTDAGYIAHTTDGGKTWHYQDSIALKMLAVDFIDSLHGFAVGTNWNNSTGFIYSTTNSGKSWGYRQFISSKAFWDIGFIDDKNGWITNETKLLKTTDGGETWQIQLEGLPTELRKLIILKKDKIAYAFGDQHFQLPFVLLSADLSDLTQVDHSEENITKEFYLEQNFPNPFNPYTEISYSLPMNSLVKLVIYDVLGREVAELVNEVKVHGQYTVQWNANKFTSGVYFYQLKVGAFNEVKKMLLLK